MKILFVGLNYHTYTSGIVSEMRELGAEVTYVDIQPRGFLLKVLRTLGPAAYERFLHRHHEEAIENASRVAYDKVIFLQAHQMSLANLERLKNTQPKADFTLYNWDSLSNHDYRPQAPFFDRVLTFDSKDAAENGYGYLRLFCQRSMQGLSRAKADPRTLFMVGNVVKPARYTAVEAFRSYCLQKNLSFRQHLKVSPVVWLGLVRAGVRPRGVSFRSIDFPAFREMIETSAGVFDFANHAQSGQTMRMMENLCTGKKIVTNNQWVKQEPFYSPDRIHVFDGTNFEGIDEFLRVKLVDADNDFPEYHIQSFVRQLVGVDSPSTMAGLK